MIRTIRFMVTLAAAIVLQASFTPLLLNAPFVPNLTIFFVVHLGLREPFCLTATLTAFLIGILQDCFSGRYFGLHGLIYLIIYLVLGQTSERLYTDNRLLLIATVFFGCIFEGIVTSGLLLLFSESDNMFSPLFSGILPHAVFSSLAALLLDRAVPGRPPGYLRR